MTDFYHAAMDNTRRGFSIIPVRPDKKPYIQWAEYQKRKPTEEEIKHWSVKWPKAMIGIVTGEISNLFVVDCDTLEGFEAVQQLLPDSLVTPIVRTPRGGWHIYFLYPGNLTIAAGIMPGVDIRGEGGYIIAPPSINAEGKAYAWQEGLSIDNVPLAPLPCELTRAINNNSTNKYNRERVDSFVDSADFFTSGRRDEDVFSLANALVKSKLSEKYIQQVIDIVAQNCNPPFSREEAAVKIQSAIERANRRDSSLASEVREFLLSTNGVISSTEIYNCLQLSTRDDRKNISIILKRLCDEGIIEKYGNKNGQFRRLDDELEPIDFLNASNDALALQWLFGIQNLVKIHPGNVLGCAGEPNSGKTALALNFARLQQDRFDVHYFSSEMGKTELRERLLKFPYPLESWKVHFWERSSNFADVIRPDGINIIDFLEIHDEFYKIGLYIKDIFEKLKTGIAFILIQKNKNTDFGLGGMRSLEKARLYLAMEPGCLKIVKAKNWASQNNPNGLSIDFKLVNGCQFMNTTPWKK
ncbi:MAG: bifunctional DNA primase/polymerase [Syntrophaceae bacterium]|nr:bifunctional DNA primase/polymerase [Syntrophaceae bacterium]